MSILSRSKILSLITEDIEWFKGRIERGEMVDKILISPFEARSLGPTSYDLHIGDRYISLTGSTGLKDIRRGRKLVIEPGESVTLVSREYLGLPPNISGIVFSKVSLLERGLSQISTYIHPGFYGPLRETLTNLSNKQLELDHGSAFCQVVFFEVPEGKADERYMGNRRDQKEAELEQIHWGPNPRTVERAIAPIAVKDNKLEIDSARLETDKVYRFEYLDTKMVLWKLPDGSIDLFQIIEE